MRIAREIVLTEQERAELKKLVRSKMTSVRLALRARIVLLAAQGPQSKDIEPKAGQRVVPVTERRGKVDFVTCIDELLTNTYATARRVHRVLDNLNIHFRKSLDDVLGTRAAAKLFRRVQFHYTPKQASWLNMAEIEIGILSRQCLDRRIPNPEALQVEVDAWRHTRNALQRTIAWKFTRTGS